MTEASPECPFTVSVPLCWTLCDTANPGRIRTITDIKLATNNLSRMIPPPGRITTFAVGAETELLRSMPRHPWQDRVYTSSESKGAQSIGILRAWIVTRPGEKSAVARGLGLSQLWVLGFGFFQGVVYHIKMCARAQIIRLN